MSQVDSSTPRLSKRQMLRVLTAVALVSKSWPLWSAEPRDDRCPLWRISSNHSRVYLIGHTPPRRTDWSSLRIENLLPECGELWNETNHSSSTSVQEVVARYGTDARRSLESWLNTAQQARLAAAAQVVGVPLGALAHFRPWLAGQTLEGEFFGAREFPGANADRVLVAQAQKLGIPVSSEFTTLEAAAQWFSQLSPEAETQYLLYICDEILVGHDEGQVTYAAWTSGDSAPATAWVNRLQKTYPSLYSSIVVERNQRWVPRIQGMLKQDKPRMVVVGFYHLVGPDSIQTMLAAQRVSVRRIDG